MKKAKKTLATSHAEKKKLFDAVFKKVREISYHFIQTEQDPMPDVFTEIIRALTLLQNTSSPKDRFKVHVECECGHILAGNLGSFMKMDKEQERVGVH